MDKKYLAVIGLVIVLVSVISVFILSESLSQNSTAIADSFELRVKDIIPPNQNKVAFVRSDNRTLLEESFLTLYETRNLVTVSETEFLDLTYNYIRTVFQSGYSGYYLGVLRCQNTFYIITDNKVIASCTPTRILETYTPTVPSTSPSPSPTPDNSGFEESEQVQIRGISFLSNDIVAITIKNTGTLDATIQEVWINNVDKTSVSSNAANNAELPLTIPVNSQYTINTNLTWITGNNYQFKLISTKGNLSTYVAVAPS